MRNLTLMLWCLFYLNISMTGAQGHSPVNPATGRSGLEDGIGLTGF